jgi:hypothetical protein
MLIDRLVIKNNIAQIDDSFFYVNKPDYVDPPLGSF